MCESFLMILLGGLVLWSCCLTYGAAAKEYFLQSSDKEILDFLLQTTRYDRRIRPPTGDGPLIVNVSVLLLSLSSPDESSLIYEVEFLLHQHWVDPRLKHDDAERHPYLSGMHHLDYVWLPDTFFIKTGTFKEPLEPDNIALKIYRNGTVHYTRRRQLILSCQGDLNIFPFDDPYCTFSMESISYEKQDLHLYWRNETASDHGSSVTKSKNLQALNAYLIYNKTVVCDDTFAWRGNYSCIKVDLMFTRDDANYFSTVFFPGIILVTSSFITFWLEWNAVLVRILIGVSTMLYFITNSNSFRATLPVVTNLSAMNTWDRVCMGFIYVSLLEFVVVNYVGRWGPKHNMVYMPGENEVTQDPAEVSQLEYTFKANKKGPPHPIRVAKSIDVISRIVFPCGFFIFLFYFFSRYKGWEYE